MTELSPFSLVTPERAERARQAAEILYPYIERRERQGKEATRDMVEAYGKTKGYSSGIISDAIRLMINKGTIKTAMSKRYGAIKLIIVNEARQ